MGVDAATFRSVLGQWPSGVTVVTTVVDGRWHGMTASSFSSVSLDPPLVSVCLARSVWTHELIATSGVFAVNILAKDQAAMGMLFAGQRPEVVDRFEGLSARAAETGAPVLTEALGWLDCRVVHAYEGGDHTIFVGEVVDADTPRLTAPLLFHSRAWGQFADLLPDEAHVEDTGLIAALLARGAAPEHIATTVAAVRDCGIRVRLADLSEGALSPRHLTAAGPARVDVATASAQVATPEQVAVALGLGVGHVDMRWDAETGPTTVPAIVEVARAAGMSVGVRLDDAFADSSSDRSGSAGGASPASDPETSDPETSAEALLGTLETIAALGPDQITLADVSRAANPLNVRRLLQDAVNRSRPVGLSLALSDHAGLGLANALTAMKSGVRRFEATLGGIDGQVPLEDLLNLVNSLEISSPADHTGVLDATRALRAIWGIPLASRTLPVDDDQAFGQTLQRDTLDLDLPSTNIPTAGGIS